MLDHNATKAMERRNKPSALAATPASGPQATVDVSDDRVKAVLPSGESVEILMYGATVISWKDTSGQEKLWLSEGAKLDGSKAVRGGIPLVFPVFGQAPDHAAIAKLPQHGFARITRWEFLGKSSESDSSVKLDFGLGNGTLDGTTKKLWPHAFGIIYSVTLSKNSLNTSIAITNEEEIGGGKAFDLQVLTHTYLRINDITKVQVAGLEGASFVDKVDGAKTKSQSGSISIAGETDRVYTTKAASDPVTVTEGGKKVFSVVRDNLGDVVIWNPWIDKAAGMGDFAPKDGYKSMICVEAGAVSSWQSLDPGETFEASQTITCA